jgi:hypothetical protein
MSRKISLGKKKKSFNSIMEAARLISAQTGEDVKKIYMRSYMRMRANKPVKQALFKAPRQYVRKQIVEVQQVGV